ncbi:MAG: hypothetical protein V4706_14770 [Pseudomonadota bacterium]
MKIAISNAEYSSWPLWKRPGFWFCWSMTSKENRYLAVVDDFGNLVRVPA